MGKNISESESGEMTSKNRRFSKLRVAWMTATKESDNNPTVAKTELYYDRKLEKNP